MTFDEFIIKVPREETLEQIRKRVNEFNCHINSYTWKNIFQKSLDMTKTLDENSLGEDLETLDHLDIPSDDRYITTILLIYNDDLTIA